MALLTMPALVLAQGQSVNKSVKIESIKNQDTQNINEFSISSPTVSQKSSEIKSTEKENDCFFKLFTDPTALFTFLLFVATCALCWITYRLVTGADKNAQMQLRAYISMKHEEKIYLTDSKCPAVSIVVKNHGKTPAHSLMCCVYICLHKWPLEIELDSPVFAENASQTTLAPHEQIRQYAELPRELNLQEIEAIEHQKGAIVVWGEVRYTDVFGGQRRTSLCLYSTGDDLGRGELAYHSHGNDSD